MLNLCLNLVLFKNLTPEKFQPILSTQTSIQNPKNPHQSPLNPQSKLSRLTDKISIIIHIQHHLKIQLNHGYTAEYRIPLEINSSYWILYMLIDIIDIHFFSDSLISCCHDYEIIYMSCMMKRFSLIFSSLP